MTESTLVVLARLHVLAWPARVRVHPRAFRLLVVACLALTLLITWPLWQARATPPLLPALPLPSVDVGPGLLAALALALVRPRAGLVLFAALLGYGVLSDQTRLQPEVVSLLLLLWGTLDGEDARLVARTHLITLWLYAGLNKLLSPAFLTQTAPWMLRGLTGRTDPALGIYYGYLIAGTELALGLLALFPRTRPLAAWLALPVHGMILLTLSPLGHNWNAAVWPWNAALAVAGLVLLAGWRAPLAASWRRAARPTRALALVLLVAPAGFYVGLTPAYLAHNLYSANTPDGLVNRQPIDAPFWSALSVPMPPEPHLFEQYFRLTCKPGDTLEILDTRWWFERQGLGRRVVPCAPGETAAREGTLAAAREGDPQAGMLAGAARYSPGRMRTTYSVVPVPEGNSATSASTMRRSQRAPGTGRPADGV